MAKTLSTNFDPLLLPWTGVRAMDHCCMRCLAGQCPQEKVINKRFQDATTLEQLTCCTPSTEGRSWQWSSSKMWAHGLLAVTLASSQASSASKPRLLPSLAATSSSSASIERVGCSVHSVSYTTRVFTHEHWWKFYGFRCPKFGSVVCCRFNSCWCYAVCCSLWCWSKVWQHHQHLQHQLRG